MMLQPVTFGLRQNAARLRQRLRQNRENPAYLKERLRRLRLFLKLSINV